MRIREMHAVMLALLGCGKGGTETSDDKPPAEPKPEPAASAPITTTPPSPQPVESLRPPPPEWVVIRVGRIEVGALPPTGDPWDGDKTEANLAETCKGLAEVGTVTGIATGPSTGMRAFGCDFLFGDTGQRQSDPKLPDLVVLLKTSKVEYRSFIAFDQTSHTFDYEFLVPMKALDPSGLVLSVADADNDDDRDIGSQRLTPDSLAALAQKLEMVDFAGEAGQGLIHFEVQATPWEPRTDVTSVKVDVSQGGKGIANFPVIAGQRIKLKATGKYVVGSYFDDELGPKGYKLPNDYNLREPQLFRDAGHAATIALVGQRGALHPVLVTPCAQFITPYSGTIWVGVNDRDFSNNKGRLEVRVARRQPALSQWSTKATQLECE